MGLRLRAGRIVAIWQYYEGLTIGNNLAQLGVQGVAANAQRLGGLEHVAVIMLQCAANDLGLLIVQVKIGHSGQGRHGLPIWLRAVCTMASPFWLRMESE